MLTTLNIVIGLVFVLLMFSLLATAVMEVISSLLSLKARNLRHTLENMLGDKMSEFLKHPLFRQLTYATNYRQARLSSYYLPRNLSREAFTAIVQDMLHGGDLAAGETRLKDMEEGDAKRMLTYLLRRSGGDPAALRANAGYWFDEVMERSSDWYKRTIKWWLFGVGFALALIFNADTLQMYHSISSSAMAQGLLVDLATDYALRTEATSRQDTTALSLDHAVARLDTALQRIEYIRSPLGLGWQSAGDPDKGFPWWLLKLAGLLITAIATTLGAPFWYDLLRKLLSMRGGGSGAGQGSAAPPAPMPEAPPPLRLPAHASPSNPVG
ncbi:MAG: hypothetical protein ACK4NS_03160 [Saprospiraceae bacterium]